MFLAAAYALFILSCLKNISNPDVFWHLSAGDRLLATGRLPRADWLSFSRAGAPWVDFEWGAQAVFALVFKAAGWWGLIALKTVLLLAAAAVIERALARRGVASGARACAVVALSAAWAASNDLRPDCFSLLLFCVELDWLERLRTAPAGSLWKTGVWAGLFGAVWANVHAGFVAGLAVAGVYALLCGVPSRKALVAALGGGIIGTLLTPFGTGLYHVIVEHLRVDATISAHIREWNWSTPANFMTWPMWALLAYAGWSAWRQRPKAAELAAWAALLGLGVMAVRHQRNMALFAAAAVFLPTILRHPSPRPRAAWLTLLIVAVFLARAPQDLSRSGWRASDFPVGAADFIESHPEIAAMPMYDPWGWGGYLGWRLKPPYRVFMDGRYLFHDLLAEAMAGLKDPRSWQAFLDTHGLNAVLLTRDQRDYSVTWEDWDGKRHDRVFPYHVLFMPPVRWRILYEDEISALYVRKKDTERYRKKRRDTER